MPVDSTAIGSTTYQSPRVLRSLVAFLIAAYVGRGTKTNPSPVLEPKVSDAGSAPGQTLSRDCSCHIPLDILELSILRESWIHPGYRYFRSVFTLHNASAVRLTNRLAGLPQQPR